MQTPTVGRIVHFFPISESDKHLAANTADRIPALIIQVFSPQYINAVVFPMNSDCPTVLRYSVPSKEYVVKGADGKIAQSYWDWPEIIPAKVVEMPKATLDGESGDLTFKKFGDDNRA